jgi:ParB family chromosome partitioning protein
MGHARALLSLADAAAQRQAAREVISRGLSVRDTELLIKKLAAPKREPEAGAGDARADVHTRAAEDRMRFALGSRVKIIRRGTGGVIQIDFGSENELNRIYELLTAPR